MHGHRDRPLGLHRPHEFKEYTIDNVLFTADVTCNACPLQIEGVYEGKPYYFRLRHGEWRLHKDGPEGDIIAVGSMGNGTQGEADKTDATLMVANLLGFYYRNSWEER